MQEAEIDLNAAFIDLNLTELKNDSYDLRFYNSQNEYVSLVIDNKKRIFSFDRSHSGNTGFSEKFANTVSVAPFEKSYRDLNIKIWIDKASVEIFIDQGDYIMTEIFFMNAPVQKFSLKVTEEIKVKSLVARPIKL
ncbi:MAG: GH32 C-terminal domain-containing protein [Flavobacteriaceae bacterium]|nr:GH32 C-terminal domain-containing protein [Flavobacteriaceae bacterium]